MFLTEDRTVLPDSKQQFTVKGSSEKEKHPMDHFRILRELLR